MATRSGDKVGGRRKDRRGRTAAEDDNAWADAPSSPPRRGESPDEVASVGIADPVTAITTAVGARPEPTGIDAEANGPAPVPAPGNDPVVERAWTDRAAIPLRHHQGWGQQPLAHQGWSGRAWTGQSALADPGDTHLRPFTSTAQVPSVGGWRYDAAQQPFVATGVVPAVMAWRRPRVPLALRVTVWLTALALVAGIAGLVVHRVRPKWLKAIEVSSAPARPAAPAAAGPARSTSSSQPTRPRPTAPVILTAGALNSASVSVAASDFNVVVVTQAPCWVMVTGPASFKPLFEQTLPAGTTQVFPSSQGQLTVQVGASHVVVTAQIGGKTVPGWFFVPSAVPFTLNFASR